MVFKVFSLGRVVLYTVFMALALPTNLVKTLAKNLVKNLVKNLIKNLAKNLVQHLVKKISVRFPSFFVDVRQLFVVGSWIFLGIP